MTDADPPPEPVLTLLAVMLPLAEVEVAHDLDSALALARDSRFDGAVADLSRPGTDARGMLRATRSAQPGVPLWVVTGRDSGGVELWALATTAAGGSGARAGTNATPLDRRILEAHEAATCAVDAQGTIIATNPAWVAVAAANGGRTETCGTGSSYLAACDRAAAHGADGLPAAGVAAGLRGVLAGVQGRYQCEYRWEEPAADRWFSVRIVPTEFDGSVGAVISHVDVTEMYRLQQALAHQTLHDVLTGLPNRLLLADRLTQALAQAERNGTEVCVAFVDLDDFKQVNDFYGHAVGDALLVQVAQRLSGRNRATDTVARYAGDEFVAVFGELASANEAVALAGHMAACLRDPFVVGAEALTISASVGVAVGHDPLGADELLGTADAAMYHAKRCGAGRIQLFA